MNHLVIYCLAGHGMSVDGQQVAVINEYADFRRYYRFWKIEADLRDIADDCQNAYLMAFCACCREIYNPDHHTNCMIYDDAAALCQRMQEAAVDATDNKEKNRRMAAVAAEQYARMKLAADAMDVMKLEDDESVSYKLAGQRSTAAINLGVRRENFAMYFGCNPE